MGLDDMKHDMEATYDETTSASSNSNFSLFNSNTNKEVYKAESKLHKKKSDLTNNTKKALSGDNPPLTPELQEEITALSDTVQDQYDQLIDDKASLKVADDQCKDKSAISDKQREAETHLAAIQTKLQATEAQLEEAKREHPEDTAYHEALEQRMKELREMEAETQNTIKLFETTIVELDVMGEGIKEFMKPGPPQDEGEKVDPAERPDLFRDDLFEQSQELGDVLEQTGEFLKSIGEAFKDMASSFASACASLTTSVEKLASMEEIKPTPGLHASPS